MEEIEWILFLLHEMELQSVIFLKQKWLNYIIMWFQTVETVNSNQVSRWKEWKWKEKHLSETNYGQNSF